MKQKDAVVEKEDVLDAASADDATVIEAEEKEEDNKLDLMKPIRESGTAGAISLLLWEGAFWAISIPVVILGYLQVTGHWPDLSDKEDLGKLGAEAFTFANVARFALPLRIALAVGTIPWVQENIVDRFLKKKDDADANNGDDVPAEE
jgi:hypothetical protein